MTTNTTTSAQTIIFRQDNWMFRSYDGRRKEFRGVTREQFERARDVHALRWAKRPAIEIDDHYRHVDRVEMLRRFAEIPYVYAGVSPDDWTKYQRPSHNGVGYVAICPGERANNIYTEDAILVALLKRRWGKHVVESTEANEKK